MKESGGNPRSANSIVSASTIDSYHGLYIPIPIRKSQVGLWIYRDRPDCSFYRGSWICVVCIRSGWDLRDLFCPLGVRP
jgi:hypothetical protein